MHINRSLWGMALALVVVLGPGIHSATALTVSAAGTVDGWGITPFAFAGAPGSVVSGGGIKSFYQNNWSPISYPGVSPNTPSPGGTTGEEFDLEEMHVRQSPADANIVQMLLVSSSAFSATVGSTTYSLGDILLDSDQNGTYDMGVVSQHSNGGLDAGRFYADITTQRLQALPGSYRGTAMESVIGPWAVGSGTALGLIPIETASHNYGGSEGLTYLTLFSFDISNFALPVTFDFHLDWGCGNDVMNGEFTVSSHPQAPGTPGIPEPATAALATLGLGALLLGLKRNRR